MTVERAEIAPVYSLASGSFSERVIVRFGVTLLANFLRAGLSFLSGILIARGLGASGYGDLNFLLGTFAAFSQLLDMGTSSAFYTFISQRQRGGKFFLLYVGWLMFQFTATVVIVGLLLPAGALERIWLGHDREIVLLAFAASFLMTQLWGMVSQLGEAIRKTVIVQAASVTQSVVHLALVGAAVYWEWLTVHAVMWLLAGEYAILAGTFGKKLLKENLTGYSNARDEGTAIIKEFAVYCKPLVVYAWTGFLYTFADRWLLQEFGGAEQQGFFAVGQQIANISLIATASILNVFWKEIAEARERQDYQRVQRLYDSVKRGLYCAAAWISCLLLPYSREILGWTVGAGYAGAWPCLALMFLYPIYQSMGQIQGVFFYASGETGSYTKISLLMMGISLPVTYVLLAPESGMVAGLGLGAVGLAIKMVTLQIVLVSLQAYVITRANGWAYDYGNQWIVLALFLSLGWACKWMSAEMLGLAGSFDSPLGVMLLGSGLYVALNLVVLFHFSSLAGLTQDQVKCTMAAWKKRPWPVVA